jgi:UDP-N-acetyl-D-glucosamine/UDP-N-acetyl-D-galactosamine dehydrogenase
MPSHSHRANEIREVIEEDSLMQVISDKKLCIVGLGYVGLPLAVAFASMYRVIGYDLNARRIKELSDGMDRNDEVGAEALRAVAGKLTYTGDLEELRACTVFIVTVPTPVDAHNDPNLTPLRKASEAIGKILKRGDLVVYESTVYPGCTEEECVPLLERSSGLRFNVDFYCGYSPERINPGDKKHTVTRIKKVTSGSTPETADRVDSLYSSVISAGTHRASSIKVAEAAKVIENSQRDINIAFVNELALIFNRIGIDTKEVLEAAGTKWNFLPFRPGLVGGHCIGVDPYYLTFKAESLGYNSQVILAGRRINDGMGFYVAERTIKLMIRKGSKVNGSRVLVLGVTFKENCPDVRNSKVVDIVRELGDFGCKVDIYDPKADAGDVHAEYGLELLRETPVPGAGYAGIVLAVAHDEFLGLDLRALLAAEGVIYDVKSVLPKSVADERL